MTEAGTETPAPARSLGFWSATALVIASMIGSGIFTTTGFLLADLATPGRVLAAWAVGGGMALLGALCYGALARHIPESGGEYLFLSRTLHPAAGSIAGWISLLVGFAAPAAAAAQAFGEYTRTWFPGANPTVLGTLLLTALTLAHAWSVRRGAVIQNVAVLAKVILILLLIGLGASRFSSLPATPAVAPGPLALPAFGMSLVWVSFSYSGWNAAVYLGSEIRDPTRNLPRSLIVGTLAVTGIYLAVNAVFLGCVPAEVIAGRLEVGRLVAEHLGGRGWAHFATALVALALMTGVSSQVMAGPRVVARMAVDGWLPAWLAAAHGPPRKAIALQYLLALGLLWTASYQNLLTFIGFTLGLCTAATVAGLVRLRWREGPAIAVPGWPWLPASYILMVLIITGLAVSRAPVPSLAGFAALGAGWGLWWVTRAGSHPTPPPGAPSPHPSA